METSSVQACVPPRTLNEDGVRSLLAHRVVIVSHCLARELEIEEENLPRQTWGSHKHTSRLSAPTADDDVHEMWPSATRIFGPKQAGDGCRRPECGGDRGCAVAAAAVWRSRARVPPAVGRSRALTVFFSEKPHRQVWTKSIFSVGMRHNARARPAETPGGGVPWLTVEIVEWGDERHTVRML